LAVDLALKAGNRLVDYCNAKGTEHEVDFELQVSEKGQPEDFCTHVDVENERIIATELLRRFPHHKIIGEEATGMGSIPPLTKDPTWIVDPIDGTTNFASGLPLTCVSIGFCDQGRPVLGVVFAPLTMELYVGVAGHGAYRNGARLADRSSQPTKSLRDSVVCAEFGYSRKEHEIDKMVAAVRSVLYNGCRTFRMLGSGVLDLCYVASGRLDVVYAGIASEGWKPWDFCAACVILHEAGCIIEPIRPDVGRQGQSFDLYSTSHICASSQAVLDEVRTIILDGANA
jgi:myo-inositol-1(or 4)-monophosphatase